MEKWKKEEEKSREIYDSNRKRDREERSEKKNRIEREMSSQKSFIDMVCGL